MTFQHPDVREFTTAVARWCLAQDDLTGFRVAVEGRDFHVAITLEWGDYRVHRAIPFLEIRHSRLGAGDAGLWLDGAAYLARAEIARKRARANDPNRLPA